MADNICQICNLPLADHTLVQLNNCMDLLKLKNRIRNGGVTNAIRRKLLEDKLGKKN